MAETPRRPVASDSGIDPLSDVLRTVRLTGAVFMAIHLSSPWGNALPNGSVLARILGPRFQRIISYHVVTHGACFGAVPGDASVALHAGDIVVFPHGDAYRLCMTPDLRTTTDERAMQRAFESFAADGFPAEVHDGGGGADRLGLICGFLGCDMLPFNPLVGTLPRVLVVRREPSLAGDRLDKLVDLTLAEAREGAPGGECVRLRLSELLFVEVIRRHLATMPAEQRGWLAGLRDPFVGRALALLHESPGRAWTLQSLARGAGASRSVLADRFTRLLGIPPMQYLTSWRMQVAAQRLAEGSAKVSTVALEVGYDSEAAFSRAFKKAGGVSPTSWRQRYATISPTV